jgi:hypothetical protein
VRLFVAPQFELADELHQPFRLLGKRLRGRGSVFAELDWVTWSIRVTAVFAGCRAVSSVRKDVAIRSAMNNLWCIGYLR